MLVSKTIRESDRLLFNNSLTHVGMTMKTKRTLLWLLPFAIAWFWGSKTFAVDPSIKLSAPAVAKNDDGTQYVTLKYNIKDVPASGAIIVLTIDCHE